jgi:hypothetical protein
MNPWLADNRDAVALTVIVCMVLAGHAAMSEAVTVVGLPDLLQEAGSLARSVRNLLKCRHGAPTCAISLMAKYFA